MKCTFCVNVTVNVLSFYTHELITGRRLSLMASCCLSQMFKLKNISWQDECRKQAAVWFTVWCTSELPHFKSSISHAGSALCWPRNQMDHYFPPITIECGSFCFLLTAGSLQRSSRLRVSNGVFLNEWFTEHSGTGPHPGWTMGPVTGCHFILNGGLKLVWRFSLRTTGTDCWGTGTMNWFPAGP